MQIPNANLDFWNFDPKTHFWANFGQESQSGSFFLKIGTHGILAMLILIPALVFWISNPKSIFGQIWAEKSQSSSFCLKIGAQVISRLLILVPTLVFWISKPKSSFGKNWTKKLKVVQVGWKLVHRVSRRCWCLFRHYFSEFPTLNKKNQSCSFWLNIATHGISRMLIVIPTIVFWIVNPKSIFGQIWAEKVKSVCFAWNLAHAHIHTQYLENVDSYFNISFLKFQT